MRHSNWVRAHDRREVRSSADARCDGGTRKTAATPVAIGAIVGAVVCAAAGSLSAATVTNPAYVLSTYASGLPVGNSPIAGMSVDPATRAIYYMDTGSAVVRRVNPNLTVTALGNLGATGYPYVSTDIEYADNNVYMANVGLYSTSGIAAGPVTTKGLGGATFTIESGIARVGRNLYITGGATAPGVIRTYNLDTQTVATPAFTVPAYASSLEYDALNNRLVGATNNSNVGTTTFFTVDLTTNAVVAVPGGTGSGSIPDYGNFAVDPLGTSIFTRFGNAIFQINPLTGLQTPFITGLTSNAAYEDVIFGPSSTGSRYSMYVADGTSILEVKNFAVPEPTGLAVLGGIAGLTLRRRRR